MADFSRADALLDASVGSVFPAAQLVVLDGARAIHERAAGDCTETTLFDIASLTKPLSTAYLTMLALDRGLISLDDEPRPGVTVRHLLAHASGLPAVKPLWPPPEEILRARPELADHAYLAVVEAVRREALVSPPGARAVYSDLGFILLGAFVEESAKQPLEILFRDWIAQPLGVGDVGFFPLPEACAPTENGLRGRVHDDNARAMGGVAGHAGLFARARDVAKIAASLMEAWRGEARLVRPETVRAFWSPSGIANSTWCLGWDRPSAQGSSAGAEWPRDGVGHLAFTGCSLWLDPPRGRGVVLLSNRVNPTRANERIKQLRPALHDEISAAFNS